MQAYMLRLISSVIVVIALAGPYIVSSVSGFAGKKIKNRRRNENA
jgi:hypothetical protein